MKITATGRQMRVTDDLKALFEKKLKKFDRFFRDDAEANVRLSNKHNQETVELTISSSGMLYRSEKTAETFNNAIDECIEAIDRQIRKNKTKLEKRLRDGAFSREVQEDDSQPVEEEKEYSVRVKKFPVKPMTHDEAILEMNLSGHNFYVFRNSEDGEINVVYLKEDGNYGLIIPER